MPRYIGYNFTGTANSTVVTSALNGGVTDRKYNSGVWAINGTDESSVYGKRRSGNWLTTIRWDGYTVLACNLTASAEDLSGYTPAHTVTVSGDTTFGASGADFDGTGDKIRYVGNGGDPFSIAANQDFVIQFEMAVDDAGGEGPFDTGINTAGIGAFTNGPGTAAKYFYGVTPDTGGAGAFYITVTGETWNGTWQIVRSGSTVTVYKDGISKGTASSANGAIPSNASGSAITLGSHDLSATYPTNYEMDGRIKHFQFRKGITTPLPTPFG
jgi:hypothetical protein